MLRRTGPTSTWLLLVEPIVILVIFGLISRTLLSRTGFNVSALQNALIGVPSPDWLTAAGLETVRMALKWTLLLAAAFALARYRGYGLTRPFGGQRGEYEIGRQVLLGIAAGAALLPLASVPRWYHYHVESIGKAPPIWDLIYASAWTFDFWIFMAVASFALVPLVEELFFRGYVLGSFATRFSPVVAVLLSAVVFQVVHLQYVEWDGFAIYNSAGVLVFASLAGWIVYRSNSLLPAVVMHVYGNVPRPLSWSLYELVLVVPAAIILYRLLARSAPRR